jgi:hypothetical protein
MGRKLPRPRTPEAIYLAEILDELRAIRSQGDPPAAPADDGPVRLEEPVRPSSQPAKKTAKKAAKKTTGSS